TMKQMSAVLGVLVTILAVASSIPKPDGGSCSSEFSAHPSDCNAFYQCVSGKNVAQRCGKGLHWNAKSNVCDWPDSAGCKSGGKTSGDDDGEGSDGSDSGDSSKSSGDSSTSEESVPGSDSSSSSSESNECPESSKKPKCPAKDPKNSVFFPHSDPHWYFHCSNGVAYCQPCPSPLVWNSECNTCDWEGQNNCPKSSESGDTSESSGDSSTSEESVPGSDSSSESEE
ncbi:hypothetical protein L9F63_012460, partial [Diploptera punctata]